MVVQQFYLVGYDPSTARGVDVNPSDEEMKALRTAIAAEFHIIESQGKILHLQYILKLL